MTILRLTSALAAGALAVGLLTACSPEPEPTPTPLFSSEEEAFAAAEEVYRAYHAEMAIWLSGDDEADPLRFTTGQLLETDQRTRDQLQSRGLTLQGEAVVVSFTGTAASIDTLTPKIQAVVCIDNQDMRVINSEGNDVTPDSRQDLAGFDTTFVSNGSHLLVAESQLKEDATC